MPTRESLRRSAARQSGFGQSDIESGQNSVIAKLFNAKPSLGKSMYAMLQEVVSGTLYHHQEAYVVECADRGQVLIKEKRRIPISERQLLEHYSIEQLVQTATEMCYYIEKRTLFTQDLKDMIENLMLVTERIYKLAPALAIPLSRDLTKLILVIAELASELQLLELVTPLDWTALSEIVKMREKTMDSKVKYNLLKYIPRVAELEVQQLVGSGGFGSVYKGTFTPANLTICIKIIPECRLPTIECVAADKLVASIINSPFLIQYLSVFKVEEAYVTLMEFVDGVDMKKLMAFQKYLPTDVLRIVTVQMFLGIEHLHYKGFVHRDIKMQNVLIKGTGHLKVIDFDTNKLCLSNYVKARTMAAFFKRTAREFRDNELAGTLPYMPPESFKEVESKMGFPYGRATDWWSLGVTMYRFCTGRLPFRGQTEQELQDKVLHSPVVWSASDIRRTNPDAMDLVNRLLVKNPSRRLGSGPSYRELRSHSFFGGIDMSVLHLLAHLIDVPFFKDAVAANDSNKVAAVTPKESPRKVNTDFRTLRDAPLTKQKPILTFASPGFMKLIDRLRVLREDQMLDAQLFDEHRLYGLGTYSSDRNYELEKDENNRTFDYKNLETLIGARQFMSFTVDAESKRYQGFTYGWELSEAKGTTGTCLIVWQLRTEAIRRSGITVGDLIYQIDDMKTTEGLERIKLYLRTRPSVRVSVYAVTPFRLADMGLNIALAVSWVGRKELLVTRFIKKHIQFVGAFDLITYEVPLQSATRRPVYLHILGRIDRKLAVMFPPGETMFVGDVVLGVNGASTSGMRSREEVMEAINVTRKSTVQLSILPLSPLRCPETE